MATKGRPDLDGEIDRLFRLPLTEFTTARNALAAQLKKEARTIDVERVKSLTKPSATAWAVNQLHWENPRALDQLIAVTERARKAQTGRVKNADLRELLDEKKRRIAELVERAVAILGLAGHAASTDVVRRITSTLESLAVWGKVDGLPKAGRLTADLDPPGFEALAGPLGRPPESSKVLLFRASKPTEDPAMARTRAREAVAAAEKVVQEARRNAVKAQATLAKANARIAATEKEKQEIEARCAEAKEEARAASNEAKKAAQAAADAERSLAKAKAALE